VRRRNAWASVAASILSLSAAARQADQPGDLGAALERIGAHVEQYYARARSVVCVETVHLQPLSADLMPDGRARQLVYELRVAWEPSDGQAPQDASVLRQIVTIDGRPPRPKDDPGCMDPKPVSPEPLAFLLPARRGDFVFMWAGSDRIDRRPAVKIDYKAAAAKPAEVTWHNECVSVDLPGQTRGRVWVDAANDDVLRLDEHLTGMFDLHVPREHTRHGDPTSMLIERADSSIRYRPIVFHDPDETVMLPISIESLTVIRNAGVPRLRTTQEFSNYRRFMTGGRIVK
jgi:hypothetical protein